MRLFLTVLVLCAPLLANADIYKCASAGGSVTYTDQPCPNGELVEIRDNKVGGTLANSSMVAISSELARDRLISDVNRNIRDRAERVTDLRQAMLQDISDIQRRKSWATDDIEGRLWEQSLSLEQNATATKYDAQIQAEQRNIDRLIDARQQLN